MTPEQWMELLRGSWTLEFLVLTPLAFWNAKEALLDYWSASHEPRPITPLLAIQHDALKHETHGSAAIQLITFVCLLCGLLSGLGSYVQLPLMSLVGIIAIGLGLGTLTILETNRRRAVKKTLERRLRNNG